MYAKQLKGTQGTQASPVLWLVKLELKGIIIIIMMMMMMQQQ